MKEEELRKYWIGKNPKVKDAVQEWINNPRTTNQENLAEKYGINSGSIAHHVSKLRKMGFKIPPSHPIIVCQYCLKKLNGVNPKIAMSIRPKTVGYICIECAKELFPLMLEEEKET